MAHSIRQTISNTGSHDRNDAHAAGRALGTVERRYGLLGCEEIVRVVEELDRSGDLSVADRIAFVTAIQTHRQVVVFEHDSWYVVGLLDRHMSADQAATIKPRRGGPRLMSIVDARGITPMVSPLAR
jgi:hypothetical protein